MTRGSTVWDRGWLNMQSWARGLPSGVRLHHNGYPAQPGVLHRQCPRAGPLSRLCQEHESYRLSNPEVLIDGDHDLARSFEVTQHAQHTVFAALADQVLT
ncbi:MAG: hypothetical protein Ct9H300mP14_14010 [Gammaproteobacteria bacterium]|nr:MAG: hypothetical protein Ct9H300mP14_14010 [Gammaproteobacteria bacterium]